MMPEPSRDPNAPRVLESCSNQSVWRNISRVYWFTAMSGIVRLLLHWRSLEKRATNEWRSSARKAPVQRNAFERLSQQHPAPARSVCHVRRDVPRICPSRRAVVAASAVMFERRNRWSLSAAFHYFVACCPCPRFTKRRPPLNTAGVQTLVPVPPNALLLEAPARRCPVVHGGAAATGWLLPMVRPPCLLVRPRVLACPSVPVNNVAARAGMLLVWQVMRLGCLSLNAACHTGYPCPTMRAQKNVC